MTPPASAGPDGPWHQDSHSRHNEIGNRMAEVIYKGAAAKLGKDWWKK